MRVSLLGLACVALSVAAPLVSADYQSHATYDASNWLNSFDFFTSGDPTHGFVQFIGSDEAQTRGMLAFDQQTKQVYMGVDTATQNTPNGRASIRIQTKEAFNSGLFVLDLEHMPAQACGSWPAFWSCGPNWPAGGEIDVIEGVNTQNGNRMTLHTSAGCSVSSNGVRDGTTLGSPNCNDGGASNGCSEGTTDASTYGNGFNNYNAGGIYAYEWTDDHISIWNFHRDSIPGDITANKPNPAGWGAPLGKFTECDFRSHFYQHKIIFDITFCGDWAGNVFGQDGACSGFGSCNNYVANNPGAFKEVYWKINSLKVYQNSFSQIANSTAPVERNTTTQPHKQAPLIMDA